MNTKKQHLDFYFDYLSPYAYFSWRKIIDFCNENEVELTIHPIVFGKLLDHWGQLGPAEIPPKRKWLANYCARYARQYDFKFVGPKFHPFNPLTALRLSLKEVCGVEQKKVVNAIFEAGWSHGKDIGDLQELIKILDSSGIDGSALVKRTMEPSIKELLKHETAIAIELGVFGIPTMIIDKELFWGNDQFDHMALYLKGEDATDKALIKKVLSRKRAIDRKT